ncbi:MAG: DUF5119 domain-containing protein [Rikenellaceae bacterium]|nr:DUF5119 domain-containing protein [Rikenellaceae bacterium]
MTTNRTDGTTGLAKRLAATFRAFVSLAACAALLGSCERRPLEEDDIMTTALIPVRVDWSRSNIPVTEADLTGGSHVHRVSLRFYPEDGSPVFERHLEGNIFEGQVELPVGRYRVIAMNESVDDVSYWEDAITFSDADDYDRFVATINPLPAAERAERFPFYRPAAGENVVVEPLRLASWSLDDFEVTEEMVAVSRGYRAAASDSTEEMLGALTRVAMRNLTYNVNVTAHVKNLVSAQAMHTAVSGLAGKVYLASARTERHPSTHLFLLNGRTWDTNNTDGTTRKSFLSFGRLPQDAAAESYRIALDVLLVTGELYTASGPMLFDVTKQVRASSGTDINLYIPEESESPDKPGFSDKPGSIDLPYVEGGINVGDWDDEEIELN